MQQRVTINGSLQTLNDMLNDARTNRFIAAKNKRLYTDIVRHQCSKMKMIENPCRIGFEWHTSSRADYDNIRAAAKFLLDGMQEAGKLPNDNQKWVIGFDGDDYFKVAKGDDRVVMVITEYDK